MQLVEGLSAIQAGCVKLSTLLHDRPSVGVRGDLMPGQAGSLDARPTSGFNPSMSEREPNLVTSGLSRNVTQQGVTVTVEIYRLEEQPGWTLEVVNQAGTSTVWDDEFQTDDAAYAMFLATVAEGGIKTFLDQAVVIPFRR